MSNYWLIAVDRNSTNNVIDVEIEFRFEALEILATNFGNAFVEEHYLQLMDCEKITIKGDTTDFFVRIVRLKRD